MADSNLNTQNNDDAAKVGLSPWEDDLPEEPAFDAKKPQLVGSLDPQPDGVADTAKPVPFNIPDNIEEKVGAKVPAEKFTSQPPTANRQTVADDSTENASASNKPEPQGIKEPEPKDSSSIQPNSETAVPAPKPKVVAPKPADAPPVPAPYSPQTKPETGVSELLAKQTRADPQRSASNQDKTLQPDIEKTPPAQTQPQPAMAQTPQPQPTSGLDSIKPAKDPFANVDIGQPRTDNRESPTENRQPIAPQPQATTAQPASFELPKEKKKISFPKFKIPMVVSYIVAAVLLLAALTYLTELGILSIGLEKVYGLFQIETLWGGLPKNPERALAMSAIKMKENLDFKASGKVTLTVNKTIKSDITSPLVSTLGIPFALADINVSQGIKASLTASDSYYDDYYDDATVDDSASDSSSSGSSSSSSSSSSDSSTSSSDSTSTQSQSSGASYQTSEPTIKELSTEFNFTSSQDAAGADITIKKIVGKDSTISVTGSEGSLYIKSDDIKFNAKSESGKWLKYSLADLASPNPVGDVMNIKTDNGFTIVGKRSGNERVSDARCYKYTLTEVELGDALSSVGITSDMIQSMNGAIWIGVKDHLMRKIELTIVPSVSSSVSRIDFEMEISEYGIESAISIPALTNIVDVSGSSPSVTAAAGASEPATLVGDDKRKSDLASVKTALESYKSKIGNYPVASSLDKLNNSASILKAALVPNYIDVLPTDPSDSLGWFYGYKSDGKAYTLSTRLEDASDPSASKSGDIYLYYLSN
jgi:hypothetical protein